jgi:hypothetical protein
MAFAEDLAPFFADFGEACTVAGQAVTAIFSAGSEIAVGEVLTAAPTLELPASVSVSEGASVVVRGITYTVRQVVDQAPDGALRLLVLTRG